MSVNKFMHPRNIYKTPPNFKQMAIDYPEFRKYIKQDISGKISIDFKDSDTLRTLSQTLLKKDFDLNVIIPSDRLIPTIPLRLNYILWIEDLLSICNENNDETIYGIDIGTGASCIYPLIAAKKYKWNMLATEIEENSLNIAQENVNRNNLQELITVKRSCNETFLTELIDPNKSYHFCMCNPPFFSNTNDLNPVNKSRTNTRPLPRNALSGISCEVVVEGGELEFISRLIRESVVLNNQIKIFTTMVGHKSTLPALKKLLRTVDVVCFKETVFQQGHTTRWGLAWTFFYIDLRKVPQVTVNAKKKVKPPQKIVLPYTSEDTSIDEVVCRIRNILQELQMEYEEVKHSTYMYALHATAYENTWANQRRKRREKLRNQINNSDEVTPNNSSTEEVINKSETEMDTSSEIYQKRSRDEDNDDEDYYNSKRVKIVEEKPIYLKLMVIIRKISNEFHLEMSWMEGNTGRDAVHQVIQYFKNNYK